MPQKYPERRTKEQMREKDRRRYWNNLEREKARKKKHYDANRETILAKKNARRSTQEKKAKEKIRRKAYYQQNRDVELQKNREWARKNPDKLKAIWMRAKRDPVRGPIILARRKAYRLLNREKRNQQFKIWAENNREYRTEYERKRIAADPLFYKKRWQIKKNDSNARLADKIRGRIRCAVTRKGTTKTASTEVLIGCSFSHLRGHLEALFKEGMTWDNFCYEGWHIDHMRPCASFDLTDPEQQKQCFHYTNLQPMWGKENRIKGARYQPAPPC